MSTAEQIYASLRAQPDSSLGALAKIALAELVTRGAFDSRDLTALELIAPSIERITHPNPDDRGARGSEGALP